MLKTIRGTCTVSTPGPGTPPWQVDTPLQGDPLDQAPPLRSACWEIWSSSGRYASYWNAFLLHIDMQLFWMVKDQIDINTLCVQVL